MREIQIVVSCDRHQALAGEKVPGEGRSLEAGGRRGVLDLCDECYQELVQPLTELLEEYGQPPEDDGPAVSAKTRKRPTPVGGGEVRKGKPPVGERDMRCLWCPATFASHSGLTRHAVKDHQVGSGGGSVRAVFGERCPLCGKGSRLMGVHAQRAHGLKHTAALFMAAEAAGDPHGVVAERRALA